MKFYFTILLILLVLPLVSADEKKELSLVPVLKAGFGKIIEIEGKIVDDSDTRLRSHLGKSLIEVHRVGEKKLKAPLVIELRVLSFTDIKIPARGTAVRFRGYESGGFTGIPDDAFEDIYPRVATTDHHFRSWFQITRRLETTK